MTFPATPLDQTIELLLNGTWTAITSLVYGRDQLAITRGRADESQQVDRSTCRGTINNRSGNFSPRNPLGQYYGLIGRNTPMRVKVSPASDGYVYFGGAYDSNAQAPSPDTGVKTPDTANLSIVGDIDIRVDVRPGSWTAHGIGLCSKYFTVGDQRSWAFWANTDGTLTFVWSTTGTLGALLTKTSTAAITVPASGRLAVRVTLDVDNGAAGNDVKFYTAPTVAGSWTQLGSTVTTAGVTSIFNSTADLEVGRTHTTSSGGDIRGQVYAFQMYQGIAGTLRADADFDGDAEPGDETFTDGASVPWTLSGDCWIGDPAVRFAGEVSTWPQRWDVTGRDVYVPVEASGILRRLTQGTSPLKSALRRGYTSATFTPRAYWPCEDGQDATQIASGLANGFPMTFQAGTPELASHTEFKASLPLPTFNGSQWTGIVRPYTGTGKVQVWFLMQAPAAGSLDAQGVCSVYTTGTAWEWRLLYDTTTGFTFECYSKTGTQLFSNSAIGFDIDGMLLRVDIELQQNGADVDWDVAILEVGQSVGFVSSGTLSSRTIGRAHAVVMNAGGDHETIAVGHISVHSEIRSLFDLSDELDAHAGEVAGRRIERLCSEEDVAFRGIGDLEATVPLGPQLPTQLVDLLREAANADGGILYEPRDLLGLAYRARESLYNQPAALELDYTAKHLGTESRPGMEPVDDDQHLRNDITVSRVDGASARAVKETGALSTLAPPNGVGVYDEEVSLTLHTDGQLADQAGWRLLLGTVDEARYPVLTLDLSRAPFVASSTLALAVQDLDVGDRLTIENPPAWLPPDDISQLAQGFSEILSNFHHRVDVNCAPERPFGQVGIYQDTESRYSSDGSTLAEDLTTTETAVDVATPTGPLWSDLDGDFDVIIAGERMTVTAITGAASPQTFTVTRSVNGVVKTQSTGAAVELFRPAVYAI